MTPPQPEYTLTCYVALPGTPWLSANGADFGLSTKGHAYYCISDGQTHNGYGFSTDRDKGSGVRRDEYLEYQKPAYARTMEITREQYEILKDYGESGVNCTSKSFDVTRYHPVSNACTDFVWIGLHQAGIGLEQPVLDPAKFNVSYARTGLPAGRPGEADPGIREFEGAIYPKDNIPYFERIKDPIPGSVYNITSRHPPPAERSGESSTRPDKDLSVTEELRGERSPAGVDDRRADVAVAEVAKGPFDNPLLNRIHAAARSGDGNVLAELGRQISRSEAGVQFAQLGEQLYAQQQQQQQDESDLVRR